MNNRSPPLLSPLPSRVLEPEPDVAIRLNLSSNFHLEAGGTFYFSRLVVGKKIATKVPQMVEKSSSLRRGMAKKKKKKGQKTRGRWGSTLAST